MKLVNQWAALIALAVVASCGGAGYGGNSTPTSPSSPGSGGNPGGSNSNSNAITVGDNFFSPSSTTVPVNTKITWTWGGYVSHNVTFDDGTASGTQLSGTFARTFGTAGTYKYHCTIHGSSMSGVVTVQ